jgi:general secretion pathway protein J
MNNKGFTLLELLISMTILSIVAVLILQALRISSQVWEKGESRINHMQRSRISFDTIFKQLSSAYPFTAKDKIENKDILVFEGNSDSIKFVTTRSIGHNSRGGLFYVSYSIEEDLSTGNKTLIAYQQPVFLINDFEGDELMNEGDFITLISDIEDVKWDYLWDSHDDLQEINPVFNNQEKKLPQEITMTVEFREEIQKYPAELKIPVIIESGNTKGLSS